MSDSSPILSLPYIQPAQAQKHVTHNEALRMLDALVQSAVLDRDRTAPPAAPGTGARHLVAAGASGDWAGQEGRLAVWDAEAGLWRFLVPVPGWQCFVLAEGVGLVFTATGWQVLSRLAPQFPFLGIATAADETNRLAVAAEATLLTHAGAGHQLKVNKAAAANTASLLFQTGWSGRAEMGLAGNDDFSLKVSANGSSFATALQIERATGKVLLPKGAGVTGTITGTAVQATQTDVTAGRLLKVGAFGLGAAAPLVGNAAVTDDSLAPGFYAYDTAQGSSGGPAGVQSGLLLHQRRAAGGAELQLFLIDAGAGAGGVPGITLSRARGASGWSAWLAGGTVESGSNGQGRYIRHQDGTQTCWQTVTTATGAEVPVTFPQPFASTTGLAVTAGVTASTTVSVAPRITARTATGCNLSAFNGTNGRVAVQVDLIAMGRWY